MQAFTTLLAAVLIITVSADSPCWRKATNETKFTDFAGADLVGGMGMKLLSSRAYCNNPDIVDVYVAKDDSTEGFMCIRTAEAQVKYCGKATACCILSKKSTPTLTEKVKTTDGDDAANCPQDTFLRKLTCEGGHCDDVLTECAAMKGLKFGNQVKETEEISDNNFSTSGFCPTGLVATGFGCRNTECGIIKLRCHDVVDEKNVSQKFADTVEQGCKFTPPFSEEDQNFQSCDNNFYVRGLSCSGRNCDDMSLYCCPKV